MNPRERRLVADLNLMEERASLHQLSFETEGTPPESYDITFEARGIALDGRRIIERTNHECQVYLHRDYPRRPPVVTWKTPIYHPNLLGPERNGGVCIGSWTAAESLVDLMTRLQDLVSFRSFSLDDALDTDAAAWVRRFSLEPGFDVNEVLGIDVLEKDERFVVEVRN